MTAKGNAAPGGPGQPPRWASGAKTGVGTAINSDSSVWFTLSHGILNEVFFPFVDTACTRRLELVVTDRRDFLSTQSKDTQSRVQYVATGVPAYHLVNTCKHGRYRLENIILADPHRSGVLQQIEFTPLQGKMEDYALFFLLSPHLGNEGAGNTGWVGDFKGVPMLFARRADFALALASTAPWRKRSAGFAGVSDGWQDLSQHRQMAWTYDRAADGNVVLTGEVDLEACGGKFVLALALGYNEAEAGHRARAGLLQGFKAARDTYVREWSQWQQELTPLKASRHHPQDLYRISALVLRTHEGKNFPGGMIASLAIPWGFANGDDDLGYHLVWPRDMTESIGALLAVSKHEDARRVLFYFEVTQEADGRWPQNMRLDGSVHAQGIQLDETAFVILLVEIARREKALSKKDTLGLWRMVRLAAGYLVRNGPVTPMDRWEEASGYFASTMAVEIAALVAAADLAELAGEPALAVYLRETADAWNDAIERLIYITGTELARKTGVDGYYVRFARPDQMQAPSPAYGTVELANYPAGQGHIAVADLVSPDALALVRFGLRAADDPRIVNTVRVLDATLKVDTPGGPCWHRYTRDGYGEHEDGSPFDGTGIGRAWPLLTGERAHYELAAGRKDEAEKLLRALESFANASGLLPEQIWDTQGIPERELFLGKPSGSAMPLVWAHAEYLKLRRSLQDGRIFDMPHQTARRYVVKKARARHVFWRFTQECRAMPPGKVLRLEVLAPAEVHWSTDGWQTTQQVPTRDSGVGIHFADLSTNGLRAGAQVAFTFRWREHERWEGKNFTVSIEDS